MRAAFIIGLVLFLGCSSSYEEELIGRYSIKALDVRSNMAVYYQDGEYLIGVIKPTVFSFGFNDEYIIVKQHPENFPEIDRSVTNYFIIPLKDKVSQSFEKNLIGPMTEKQFKAKREELGISDELTFSETFKDLE